MNASKIHIDITSNDLSHETKEAMWAIYQPYYHYEKETFLARFVKNNHYALYYSEGTLVGFTGLRINHIKIEHQKHFLIYFGQTVVTQGFRGKGLIRMTGMKLIRQYWKEILLSKAWFWADALSYKAYLVFAKNLKEYYPTRQYATPAAVQKVFDFIGETHYGETYDPSTGTVCKTVKYVADPTTVIRAEDQKDLDVAFYAKSNPNNQQGHGLITLGPISLANVIRLIKRSVQKARTRKNSRDSWNTTKGDLGRLSATS